MTLADILRKELKRSIIQRQITCPITGKVLDVRTAVFSVDNDGDPQTAFDPSVTEQEVSDYADLVALASAVQKGRAE